MKQILIATSNQGKFDEIMEVLSSLSEIEFISLKDLNITDHPIEDGDNYLENARIKAEHYQSLSGLPVISEDSGIEIDALHGELGMHTRRWGAGPDASDEEWIEFFMDRMKKENNKDARFKCTAYLIDSEGDHHYFEGSCDGVITDSLEAPIIKGIPISSCFLPSGMNQVYANLGAKEKNKLSHRGKAIHALKKHLSSYL